MKNIKWLHHETKDQSIIIIVFNIIIIIMYSITLLHLKEGIRITKTFFHMWLDAVYHKPKCHVFLLRSSVVENFFISQDCALSLGFC